MLVCKLSSPVSGDGPAATTAFVKVLSGSAVACVVAAARRLRRLEGSSEGPALAVRLRVCAYARLCACQRASFKAVIDGPGQSENQPASTDKHDIVSPEPKAPRSL